MTKIWFIFRINNHNLFCTLPKFSAICFIFSDIFTIDIELCFLIKKLNNQKIFYIFASPNQSQTFRKLWKIFTVMFPLNFIAMFPLIVTTIYQLKLYCNVSLNLYRNISVKLYCNVSLNLYRDISVKTLLQCFP